MSTKLTLSVDAQVVALAKLWAQGHQRSVSSLVEGYLRHLGTQPLHPAADAPVTNRLYGACKTTVEFGADTESLVADLVAEKHR